MHVQADRDLIPPVKSYSITLTPNEAKLLQQALFDATTTTKYLYRDRELVAFCGSLIKNLQKAATTVPFYHSTFNPSSD